MTSTSGISANGTTVRRSVEISPITAPLASSTRVMTGGRYSSSRSKSGSPAEKYQAAAPSPATPAKSPITSASAVHLKMRRPSGRAPPLAPCRASARAGAAVRAVRSPRVTIRSPRGTEDARAILP